MPPRNCNRTKEKVSQPSKRIILPIEIIGHLARILSLSFRLFGNITGPEEAWAFAKGEEVVTHELLLRHPGQARITTRRDDDPMSRDYEVWLSDGQTSQTYKAAVNTVAVRALQTGVVGSDTDSLPLYAQQRETLTQLPSGTSVVAE